MNHTRPLGARQDQADRFVAMPTSVFSLGLQPRAFQLVTALLSFRWYSTSPIIPSVRTLAALLDCSERTVRRTAASLEARGLLVRRARYADDDRQMSNEYELAGLLLALVTAADAIRGRAPSQPWQGRRSPAAGKRDSAKHQQRKTRQSQIPTQASAYLETRGGLLQRR